ncbi:metal ABC transporter solute-binding protein, Zn/Mn family [Cellulomonas marina]|uniref:Zinc/manganese transport system substrate-binding protein n=1 Tax=Cellulomonas marina TaxID=988821 RepID=A0A1I0ZIB3_9CELL|nr:zinc ABC transporter substrate-binding protein [Cellulomonas marina]GIG28568.1 ABC transporter substrate-binding protein [Cellulomonas marina]SFB24866.1 zinc/manganese transport system substrate-binding protein [Cellulomonas marina]
MRRRALLPAALVPALLLAACSSGEASAGGASAGGAAGSGDEPLAVVASTNVWGDVAAQVGGDRAEVTSIVDDPSADPHSFELTARDQLAVSRADLVVQNGGHYDDWLTTALDALDEAPPVVEAVADGEHADEEHAEETHSEEAHAEDAHAGHDHSAEGNEHVWYDLPLVAEVATRIAEHLGELDPEGAETYTANAEAFGERVAGVQDEVAALAAAVGGTGVAATEPVPGYLLEAAGLEDRTPAAYSGAIEEETDVPPAAMAEMLALFPSGQVALLVENPQTTGPQTDEAVAAAEAAGVPVVEMTETLPEGEDYVGWMSANVAAVRQALGA